MYSPAYKNGCRYLIPGSRFFFSLYALFAEPFQFLKLLIAIINKIAHIAAMVLKYHFGGIDMPFLRILANPNILNIFITVALLL